MGIPAEFFEEFATTGNAAGFIAEAQAAEMGVTESRELFRELGGAISNQAFSNLWAEQLAAAADRQALQGADWFGMPDEGLISDWTTVDAQGYVYHFDVTERIVGTEDFASRLMSIRTGDLISPNEAFARLADVYDTGPEQGTDTPRNALVGGVLLNIFRLTPAGS